MREVKKVAVMGAGGKMGSGIAQLLLSLMAMTELAEIGKVGSGAYSLKAIDLNEASLLGLKESLKKHLIRFAEKNINSLRAGYAQNTHLISNAEIIDAFVTGAMTMVDFGSDLKDAKGVSLIFEAVIEDVPEKCALFKKLKEASPEAFFFTNTSSIPIAVLSDLCQLNGKLIGFHFYNPPAVQRLVEIIKPASIDPGLSALAEELASLLNKTVVHSADVAGFIGNGYFIREIQLACDLARSLAEKSSVPLALQQVDYLTKAFLLRPMGLFQLLDYVGLDVAKNIFGVMSRYLPDPTLYEPWLEDWLKAGVRGGQQADGSPKDGIFQYANGKPSAVYDLNSKTYIPLTSELGLGHPPLGYTWKQLHKDPAQKEKIAEYFAALGQEKSLGAMLAKEYLLACKGFADKLVRDKVAKSSEDVSTVLKLGFYHLYGPQEVTDGL